MQHATRVALRHARTTGLPLAVPSCQKEDTTVTTEGSPTSMRTCDPAEKSEQTTFKVSESLGLGTVAMLEDSPARAVHRTPNSWAHR